MLSRPKPSGDGEVCPSGQMGQKAQRKCFLQEVRNGKEDWMRRWEFCHQEAKTSADRFLGIPRIISSGLFGDGVDCIYTCK